MAATAIYAVETGEVLEIFPGSVEYADLPPIDDDTQGVDYVDDDFNDPVPSHNDGLYLTTQTIDHR
jgi:hypothetical protein